MDPRVLLHVDRHLTAITVHKTANRQGWLGGVHDRVGFQPGVALGEVEVLVVDPLGLHLQGSVGAVRLGALAVGASHFPGCYFSVIIIQIGLFVVVMPGFILFNAELSKRITSIGNENHNHKSTFKCIVICNPDDISLLNINASNKPIRDKSAALTIY